MLKQQIEHDLKAALLEGDKDKATLLRGLKSAILYVEVAKGSRGEGLTDAEIIDVLFKEAKKRQESADLYSKGGRDDLAASEMAEKEMIIHYLPAQLSDAELVRMVDAAIAETQASDAKAMGQVIGIVKQKAGASADGGRIAALVKERLSK